MTIYDEVFGKSFPFAIGFDRTLQLLNRAEHLHDNSNYPPYNIVKIDAENFSIELAIAGFDKKDISITKEKETPLIEGSKETLSEDTEYVHRGLSGRTFNRRFTLADDIIVKGADMKNGILSVSLERVIPEEDKPVEIKIK